MDRIAMVRPRFADAYPVTCGGGVAAALAAMWRWPRAVLIADHNTDRLFADSIEQALAEYNPLRLRFEPGEDNKIRATKQELEDAMLAAGIDRRACVVAIGGGIALDVAGFVAATYMRGIDHVNVATTLLAQVDAAVGGKTGVNTPEGKNLVGAFHQPKAVFIDTDALRHLGDEEMRNGLAEAIKHAVLKDAHLFSQIEAWAGNDLRLPDPLIARCVVIKAEVVAADEHDKGMRNILNYGHTVAHAIEHATRHRVAHGHAVAIGMVIETRLAVQQGHFDAGELRRIEALLNIVGLPTAAPCSFDEAAPYFTQDKKAQDGVVYCAIPRAIGRIEANDAHHPDRLWLCETPLSAIAAAWGRLAP